MVGSADRVAALDPLAARYGLAEAQRRQLEVLAGSIAGDARAPTTVRDLNGIIERHLADSLVALELEVVRAARCLADIGTGAGMPGLALAIALPRARVCLLESHARKCEFITRAARACRLANVTVVNERAETWEAGRSAFDLVTARAVAPFPVVIEYAAPLLRVGGHLVAWRGHRDAAAEADAERASRLLGLAEHRALKVQPFAAARERHLHLVSKVMETPARFPRRPGVALKHPLGS